MAKQQIPLVKVRFLDNFTDPENPREMFRPGIMRQAVITNEKLIQNICNHSGQKEAQVIAVLAALPDAVKDYATAGHSVQIDNLCTIRPVIHCRAVDTPEECTAQTIKSVGVSVLPIGKSAALYKKWGFRMVGDVVTGSANGDDGGVDEPGNEPNGGQTGSNTGNQTGGGQQTGGGSGNQQQTPTEVTYTFKYHDNTEDSRSGLPGEAVDAPYPDDGYEFTPEVPSVFGSTNMTFIEQLIAALKYTVAWYLPNGNPIVWYDLAEGETIPDAPTPPDGYHWHPYPSVMPNHDLDIIPEPNA